MMDPAVYHPYDGLVSHKPMGTACSSRGECRSVNAVGLTHLSDLVRRGIPWRQTFLRRHLAQELDDPYEILVLRDLSRSATVTPSEFFYNDKPDYRSHRLMAIGPLKGCDRFNRVSSERCVTEGSWPTQWSNSTRSLA